MSKITLLGPQADFFWTSIADKFVAGWKPILGTSYRTVEITDLELNLESFVASEHFPQLTEADNATLLAPIEAADILQAVKGLERRKAAGEDGFNNDFFKDFVDDMMEDLLVVFNEVLRGGIHQLPFTERLIPLRKCGEVTQN